VVSPFWGILQSGYGGRVSHLTSPMPPRPRPPRPAPPTGRPAHGTRTAASPRRPLLVATCVDAPGASPADVVGYARLAAAVLARAGAPDGSRAVPPRAGADDGRELPVRTRAAA
jgi:hypothetical protein